MVRESCGQSKAIKEVLESMEEREEGREEEGGRKEGVLRQWKKGLRWVFEAC